MKYYLNDFNLVNYYANDNLGVFYSGDNLIYKEYITATSTVTSGTNVDLQLNFGDLTQQAPP